MEKDTLAVAQHYYDLNKYQEAFQQLSQMVLVLDDPEQLSHHILMADILVALDRYDEAEELTHQIRTKFPDEYQALTHWIHFFSANRFLVTEAYNLAQSMQVDYPDNYWFPYIMAQMAYGFRLTSPSQILALTDTALKLKKNRDTLKLAYRMYAHFSPKKAKFYLDALVEMEPGTESTYLLLIDYLKENKRYFEMYQVSHNAIRSFPSSQKLTEYVELSHSLLYGRNIDKINNFFERYQDKGLLGRSSTKKWFIQLQVVLVFLYNCMLITTVIFAAIYIFLFSILFLHYVVVVRDERNITKQHFKDKALLEYQYNDRLTDMGDSASLLLSTSYTKYLFIYLDEENIKLAKDVWCDPESLHFDWDEENVQDAVTLPINSIKSIEVLTNQLIIKTTNKEFYLGFESLASLTFIVNQLKKHHFKLIKTKKQSRILLSIGCFLGAKIGFIVSFAIGFFWFWQMGAMFALLTVTNTLSFYIYRMIQPSKKDIYQLSH